ncbi:MAG TPA: SDR family NAD(P)-dependent oxidoreductase [Gemmataceae bacterium]|jgi:acyl transferase domain-containing protein/NAD(P)H-dependent flavin oxidoreductase YrpB (nitropropane dioxygenase family)/NAD(P)-dependent dehydrogenase (short-subunit alcohol dehydrogenase family)/acyl carrier protein
MGKLDIVVLTPAGADPALAIAACRAGARGFLDLEHDAESSAAPTALDRLARFAPDGFGVKLSSIAASLLPRLLEESSLCREVILAGGEHPELAEWITRFRHRRIRVLFEAVTIAEARRGAALDIDGLILKGHESGGRVGDDTTFIFLQRWQAAVRVGEVRNVPIYAQGGIGFHTAAACVAAGAAGVVLDNQLLLTRESALPETARARLLAFDGSETQCLGAALGEAYRCFARPGLAAPEELRRLVDQLTASTVSLAERREEWRQTVRQRVGQNPETSLWLIGQDAAFAKPMAERYRTVGGIVQALRQRVDQHIEMARRLTPLAEGSPLARRHGTRYPIVQGPMTRVSDTATFAKSVAINGALPFLALALLRRDDTEKLLRETSARLAGRPWGAGILGFAPPEIRGEQMEAVRAIRPPFALIAGGRPDQARELEKEGIPTYLHVPSPGLLSLFLRDGARRFVFEGRECGGHVGPRSSFVLWETMCALLLEHLAATGPNAVKAEELHVLFAGGIHDALSAAMVAALSAPLAERGVAVGVLVGTAYLFTEEAVAGSAIVPRYQQEALRCQDTVLLETGPGHAIRCIATPYAEAFEQEKRRLQAEGCNPNEIREALEALNVGRLRVASKGIDRPASSSNGSARFVAVEEEDQFRRGMYMIGQAASLRQCVVTMSQLHEDICAGGTRLLQAAETDANRPLPRERPSDIAIIGMACFLPGANDLRTYWENVLGRVNAITEVPLDHWDWRLYYDANPKARDKICSKWGGFLADMPFDPLLFGMPPSSLTSIEPVQLYALETVRRALADAGYADRPFDRERTAVILGAGGGAAQLAISYSFRSYLPMLATAPGLKDSAADIQRQAEALLPEWTEDSFPGILINVIAGRVANRFNFGGPNFSIDAACGSSLAALYAGVRELEMGTSDVAVVMGADTVQNPYTYMAFSKTHAFSSRGRCATFDEAADGIVISEGVAAVILKRLADAERDGDRIYAVIKGVGASSDGKDKGLTAPRPEGQLRALQRAYNKANISPARVEFVEAHGTGTVVGDQTEAASLGRVFREAGAAPRSCVVGSVKSMIGHTKCAAGLAGLVNATLALHHKVLPPLLVETPNSKAKFEESPFFLNAEARPWVHGGPEPRVAGVSAFGFGGTNFHAVLEEYTGDYLADTQPALNRWPAELLVWRRSSTDKLVSAVQAVRDALAHGAAPELADLAYSLCKANSAQADLPTLAIVATSLDDLKQKLDHALTLLRSGQEHGHDPRGIFFATNPQRQQGQGVAFLFPGQGSQYPNMLVQLAMMFPEVRQSFDEAEAALAGRLEKPLSKFIFPPSAFAPEQEKQAKEALTRTDVAQPALGAASLGLFRLLTRLGVRPDVMAGHSYGDYVALCAAGALPSEELIRLSHERGRIILEATDRMPGAMAAIEADPDTVTAALEELDGVTAANLNSPNQTVVSGTDEGIRAALERFQKQGIRGQRIPVACAFHSPLIAAASEPFAHALDSYSFVAPQCPVYANTTATPYPNESVAVVDLLRRHLASPVRFRDEIESMYAAGARVFIEVGPQGVLTGLVGQTLAGRPHLAVATDLKGRPGLVQLQHLLGQLLVWGVPVQLERLHDGRNPRLLDLDHLERDSAPAKLSPSTWLVNSVRVRPLHGPEPKLLGQAGSDTPELVPTSAIQSIPEKPKVPTLPAMKPTPAQPPAPAPHTNEAPHSNGLHQPPAPAAPPAPATAVPGDEAAQVMLRFQDLMSRFLDTQRSVMTSYLQGGVPPAVVPSLPAPVHHTKNGHSTNGHVHNGHVLPLPSTPVSSPPPIAVAPTPVVEKEKSEPAPAIAPSPTIGLDRETVTAHLLDIVCKRTGYPAEMLGLDLDLEADLGIDSIKRVEILGMLAEVNGGQTLNVAMEKLTNIKSLRGIIDCLAATNSSAEVLPARSVSEDGKQPSLTLRASIQRMLVAAVDAPLLADVTPILPGGTIVLTDDGAGIAAALAQRLRDFGQQTALVSAGPGENAFHADLTNPQAIGELLARIHQQCGPVNGLIHLLPLAPPRDGQTWTERLQLDVKSLFLLTRGLADELQHAADNGSALLLAATALGGSFGSGTGANLPEDFSPGQGGIAGLIKSLAHEWPHVLVRAVDLDRGEAADKLADLLLAELGDADGPVEVGYQAGRRLTLQCVPSPLEESANASLSLDRDSTILLTGGARGITAAVALELARRYQPNLVLVGRSPLPEESEAPDTGGVTGPAELKTTLIARLRREGRPASPAIIETAYQRLLHDREIRANIERLKQAGARVHYYQADVRDEIAFASVLDDVYRRFGTIDGVIHGAGVIQDKLIRDKTPESYDRVFGTKVESALILSRHLKFEQLKFCVFFASVAGRFGNRGQSDYAAANEVLSKLAVQLDRRWPGRFVSLAWGPWSTIGMVSELEQHLGQRGLQMIPPDVGPLFLDEELRLGRKGECEVVIAGDVGQLGRPRRTARDEAVPAAR